MAAIDQDLCAVREARQGSNRAVARPDIGAQGPWGPSMQASADEKNLDILNFTKKWELIT